MELTVDGMKDGGKGDGVLQRERETASSRGPAAQRRSCFLLFSFLSLPFLSLLTPPSHFSSRFPFAFHALLPIATTPLYLFYTRKPFPSILLFLLGFLINRVSPLSFSHLSFFLGHFTSRPSEILLSDLPIHLVIFQQVERQSHSRLCRPRSCTSCP